jgi:hypothetical protein
MDDNELISIFKESQKEAEILFEKNNLDTDTLNIFKHNQKIKLLEFQDKLKEYKKSIQKSVSTNTHWENNIFSK